MGVTENLQRIQHALPPGVTLVAVSKTKPDTLVLKAYEAGHRDFGENRVQDLKDRAARMPADIRWHMIGHLQKNKVKYLAPFVHLIQGVDSLKLLQSIDKEAVKYDRVIDCLLQLRIAEEETKFGLTHHDMEELLGSAEYREMNHVRIRGLMGMATFTENREQIRQEFQHLNAIFETLRGSYFKEKPYFNQRSIGMSGDYELALEEGTTMVRIGSLIFGPRNY